MNINIISFTQKGAELSVKLHNELKERADTIKLYTKYVSEESGDKESITQITESIYDWTLIKQQNHEAIIFIGAMGIAVRAIANGIKDKLTDAPVLVIDEIGTYVIPVIAGHVGGANELAADIAKIIEAIPVITTATDVNGAFSADVFARDNNLTITNREGIAKVSTKALEGKPVRLSIENYPPEECDIVISSDSEIRKKATLGLSPKKYTLGIGCRKETDSSKLENFILSTLNKANIDINDVGSIASINIKEDEQAILDFSNKYRIPFITYTPELLLKAKGAYEESEFVKNTTGVGNVCERAAMLLTANQGQIILHKTCKDGMTLAVGMCVAQGIAVSSQSTHDRGKRTVPTAVPATITVVGLGPGETKQMTEYARMSLHAADLIVGYTKYIELLGDEFDYKKKLSTGMRQEIDRCRVCFDEATKGQNVALVCSGDSGIYGMASLIYELSPEYPDVEIEVIPGITAAASGAAVIGAPINHDFCTISLSDLMTPWELIAKRLRLAAQADLVIALYNPSSHKRADYLEKACDILLAVIEPDRPCGYVRNIGRAGTTSWVGTLRELRNEKVDMFTTCYIGNSQTYIDKDKLITPRGYKL